jgi:hypothetical protein
MAGMILYQPLHQAPPPPPAAAAAAAAVSSLRAQVTSNHHISL